MSNDYVSIEIEPTTSRALIGRVDEEGALDQFGDVELTWWRGSGLETRDVEYLTTDEVVEYLCRYDGSLYEVLAKKSLHPDLRLDTVVDLLEARGCLEKFIVVEKPRRFLDRSEVTKIDDRYVYIYVERGFEYLRVDFRSKREAIMFYLIKNFALRGYWPKTGPYSDCTRKVLSVLQPRSDHPDFEWQKKKVKSLDEQRLRKYRDRTDDESRAYWSSR